MRAKVKPCAEGETSLAKLSTAPHPITTSERAWLKTQSLAFAPTHRTANAAHKEPGRLNPGLWSPAPVLRGIRPTDQAPAGPSLGLGLLVQPTTTRTHSPSVPSRFISQWASVSFLTLPLSFRGCVLTLPLLPLPPSLRQKTSSHPLALEGFAPFSFLPVCPGVCLHCP